MNRTESGKIILSYLERFGDDIYSGKLSKKKLAEKIYTENNLQFRDIEAARGMLRRYMGEAGEKDRKYFKNKYNRMQFDLPVSHAEKFEPYQINQTRTIILSDIHIPYQDNEAINCALNFAKEHKVTCILINGDLLDLPQISRHEPDWRSRRLEEEFDAVRDFLTMLRKEFPKAKIVFKEGNHDERWEKWLFVNAEKVFKMPEFKLETILRLGELKIDIVKDKTPIKIGKLNVLHGHELQGSGGVNPARATFLKTIDNVLIGHVHRSSQHTEPTMSGDVIVTTSQGCLCGLWPQFARVNKWNHGFSYVDLDVNTGEYHLQNMKIIKGKIF